MPAILPAPGDTSVLYVVDLSGFVFRAYHAMPPRITAAGEPVQAVHGTISTLQRLVSERRPAYLAVAIDSRGESRRKDRYPDYKANRKDRPPDLETQARRVIEIAEAYGIPSLEVMGWEADDIIATIVRGARAAKLGVVIASGDKDLLALVGDGVVMWDGMRDKVYGVDETIERLGVRPDQVTDYLSLVGDSSDNVPGVRGVGPKTAVQLLAEHHTLDGIYAALDRIEKKIVREKLTTHREDALLSRELVRLNDELPIPFELESLRWGGADMLRLRAIFRELEMGWAINALDRVPLPPLPSRVVAPMGQGYERPPTTPATVAAPTAESSPPRQGDLFAPAPPRPPPPVRLPLPPRAKPTWKAPSVPVLATLAELDAFLARAVGRSRLSLLSVLDEDDPRHGPLVGLALASGDEAAYVPIGHVYLGRPDPLPPSEIEARLARALGTLDVHVTTHDDKRERHVWARSGAGLSFDPARSFDVMLASYLLSAEEGAHDLLSIGKAVLDAELPVVSLAGRGKQKTRLSEIDVETVGAVYGAHAHALGLIEREQADALEHEGLLPLLRDLELPLAGVLYGLESIGVAIDEPRLAELSRVARLRMAELEKKCHEAAGHPFNVRSPRALEVVLFDEIGLPSFRSTKTARSTDHEVLEELAPRHPLPGLVLELRQLEKLDGTYLDALPRQRDPKDGRVHPRFNQAVAATGRLSSSDPNLQNIPIRTDEGREIRGAFVAPEHFTILSADYSQIELRVLAHVSRDPELVDAYRRRDDVHIRTAKAIFGVDEQHVTREMRAAAKTVNFAVIYGQTEVALARNLSISELEAAQYIRAFFQRYAGVARWLDEVVEEARQTGAVRTLLGRKRDVPLIHARGRMQRWAAERVAKNTPIQGSAADIMKRAMIAVDRVLRGARSRMILTVHDELVLEVHDAERDRIVPAVVHAMETAMELEVPLVVDYGVGRTWKDAH